MNRFPLLPHWALIHARYDFDDFESGTATEMTARLYKVMKDLVEDYNKFVDEVNKNITEFENSSDANCEEFINHIDKITHDYIVALDMRIAHQDKIVADAVSYLKENLGNTITDVVREMNENGELNEYITNALNNLTEQLNTFTETLNSHASEITANTESITELNGKVSDLETLTSEHTESITELNSKIDYTIEPRINEVDATTQQNKTNIGVLTERIATEEENRNTLGLKVQELEVAIGDQYDGHQADISSIISALEGNSTLIQDLYSAIYFKDQEECIVAGAMVSGMSTSGSTYVGFTIPLPKRINRELYDVEIETLNVRVRGITASTYVLNGDLVSMLDTGDIESINYTIPSDSSNLLTINLNKSSGFDVPNNIVLDADIRNMKIKIKAKTTS